METFSKGTEKMRTFVFGTHGKNPKEYCWRVKGKYKEKFKDIKAGDIVFVNTKNGVTTAKVTRVVESETFPVETRVQIITGILKPKIKKS